MYCRTAWYPRYTRSFVLRYTVHERALYFKSTFFSSCSVCERFLLSPLLQAGFLPIFAVGAEEGEQCSFENGKGTLPIIPLAKKKKTHTHTKKVKCICQNKGRKRKKRNSPSACISTHIFFSQADKRFTLINISKGTKHESLGSSYKLLFHFLCFHPEWLASYSGSVGGVPASTTTVFFSSSPPLLPHLSSSEEGLCFFPLPPPPPPLPFVLILHKTIHHKRWWKAKRWPLQGLSSLPTRRRAA